MDMIKGLTILINLVFIVYLVGVIVGHDEADARLSAFILMVLIIANLISILL